MPTNRRDFLTAAVTATGGLMSADRAHSDHDADHHHDHDHQAVPSDPALRVKALESLLTEKGLVDRAALDALVDTYEHRVGPRNGARVVAREALAALVTRDAMIGVRRVDPPAPAQRS